MITEKFPTNEQFGLVSQMRRAAVSIPSNIAEGFKRFYVKEYKHFLFIAQGSIAELETQMIISQELKFCDKSNADVLIEELEILAKMVSSLIKKPI